MKIINTYLQGKWEEKNKAVLALHKRALPAWGKFRDGITHDSKNAVSRTTEVEAKVTKLH